MNTSTTDRSRIELMISKTGSTEKIELAPQRMRDVSQHSKAPSPEGALISPQGEWKTVLMSYKSNLKKIFRMKAVSLRFYTREKCFPKEYLVEVTK